MAEEEVVAAAPVRGIRPHRTIMGVLLLATGMVVGTWFGGWILNWGSDGGIWDITVSDTYTLYLGYPLRKEGEPGYAESKRRYTVSPGTQENNSVDAEVRLVPWLFSDQRGEKGAMEASTRESLMHCQGVQTRGGVVRVTGTRMAVGPSMSRNGYRPPWLGATFVVGDGSNPAGGFTFYELRVHQGRVWSEQSLFRYDCAASGVYSTCKETDVSKNLQAGYVGPITHQSPIPPAAANDQFPDMIPLESGGTSVTAYAIIRRPDASAMDGP